MKKRILDGAIILLVSFFVVALLMAGSFGTTSSAALAIETGAVCPAGNVKYEVGTGYEYNDGSAWINANESTACWGAEAGYEVTGACIKIGGPNGGSTIDFGPGDGCGGPYDYGISHVVVYTQEISVCEETVPHEGDWVCGEWSECVNGEQFQECTKDHWTTDVNYPDIVCEEWVETKTETQWCDLCEETVPHEGNWVLGEWSECVNGVKTREDTKEHWTTDVNHPSVECGRWTETRTLTEPCNVCQETVLNENDWVCGEWSECIDGIKTQECTKDYWTTDVNYPDIICDQWTDTKTETKECLPEICEVVDTHGVSYCTPWSECVDGVQWRECTHETWTTDHYRPEIVCSRTSSVVLEEQPCEEPEDMTPAGQVELIFSCPVLEGYSLYNWDPVNNVPLGKSLFDIPGPCAPDQCKIHPRGGYWRYAESVPTMLAEGRLDPYGEYWIYLVCWDVNKGWWPVGLVRSMFYEEDIYPTFPIRWWVEAWADPNQTPGSFDHEWYQVVVPDEWWLVGLK